MNAVSTNSRTAAQRRTRERLKQVAREMMLADGYNATTIATIAERSGFTTGAFYSNFGSKAELALEILRDLQGEAGVELQEIFAAGGDRAALLGRFQEWTAVALDSGWPRMELEFAMAARGDDSLIKNEGARNRTAVGDVAEWLGRVIPAGMLDEHTTRLVAELTLDLAFGIAVRKLVAPEVHPGYLFELLSAVMGGAGT